MRIYKNCYELISEIHRDCWEMGTEVHTDTYQNKVIKDDPEMMTREILNYSYALESLDKEDYLYLADPRMKAYVNAEILDRTSRRPLNPGHSFLERHDVWDQFLNGLAKFDYTYSERIFAQIDNVLKELVKHPDSRQCMIMIWDQHLDNAVMGGKKRVPCSISYQFVHRNGKLNLIYYMRSCDVMTHFGVDVALAWKLLEYVARCTNMKVGMLYHNITSLHSYKRDWPLLKKCIDDVRSEKDTSR